MQSAVFFILLGILLSFAVRILFRPAEPPRCPHLSRFGVVATYRQLGAIERLRRHYGLKCKTSVLTIALELLEKHSRAEVAMFKDGGEWTRVDIGPYEGGKE